MKKPGEWIAALGADLGVWHVALEANEMLDLIEVWEIDRLTERPSSVRFFDRVEGARLHEALGVALDELERAAIEVDQASATSVPPRYEPLFAPAPGGGRWTVHDVFGTPLAAPIWRGDGAEQSAADFAERLNREADRQRRPAAGP
jgi:hypothetical protein